MSKRTNLNGLHTFSLLLKVWDRRCQVLNWFIKYSDEAAEEILILVKFCVVPLRLAHDYETSVSKFNVSVCAFKENDFATNKNQVAHSYCNFSAPFYSHLISVKLKLFCSNLLMSLCLFGCQDT